MEKVIALTIYKWTQCAILYVIYERAAMNNFLVPEILFKRMNVMNVDKKYFRVKF